MGLSMYSIVTYGGVDADVSVSTYSFAKNIRKNGRFLEFKSIFKLTDYTRGRDFLSRIGYDLFRA